jgi:hypothetical protein
MSDRLQCEAKTPWQSVQLNREITLKVMNDEMYHKTQHFVRVTKVTVGLMDESFAAESESFMGQKKRRNCLDETK